MPGMSRRVCQLPSRLRPCHTLSDRLGAIVICTEAAHVLSTALTVTRHRHLHKCRGMFTMCLTVKRRRHLHMSSPVIICTMAEDASSKAWSYAIIICTNAGMRIGHSPGWSRTIRICTVHLE